MRCSRLLPCLVVAVALARIACGFGVALPSEQDFGTPLQAYMYLRGGSRVVDDAKAGGTVLLNDDGYDVFGMFVARDGDFSRPLTLTVAAAREQRNAKLGVVCLLVKDGKVQGASSFNCGWNRRLLQNVFTDQVFTLDVPDRLRRAGTDLFVLLYRCNRRGVLKVRHIAVDVAPAASAAAATPASAETAARLLPPHERFHHPIFPKGTGDTLTLEFLPMGVYCTGMPHVLEPAAAVEGVDAMAIADRMFAELSTDLGCNTVYFQGTLLESEGRLIAAEMAAAATRHGLKVIAQMNDVYFRGGNHDLIETSGSKDSWDYYKRVLEPRLRAFLPRYRDNTDIWAWSPVEELHADYVFEIAEYRRLIWELCPNQRIYELESVPLTMRSLKPPYPTFVGIDRYCFWNSQYGGAVVMWTPQLALRWLRGVIRPFIDDAARWGRPCVFVMQCNAWHSFFDGADDRELAVLETEEEKRAYVNPEVPSLKYYPEHGKFGRWGFYLPPQNAMRAMCWVAVLEGAKGLFVWSYGYHYDARPSPADAFASGEHYRINLTRATPNWADLRRGFAEVRPFGALLLALDKAPGITATTDDDEVWTGGFVDAAGDRYLVVVNSRIAIWDGDSPDFLDHPYTRLNIDQGGNMINYEVAPTKTVTVSVPGLGDGETLHALTDALPVTVADAGGARLTLGPGQGTVLYLGRAERLPRVMRKYGL